MSANFPESLIVKISSEAAAEISISPVLAQRMPAHELLAVLLGVCGKDAARIAELLARGTVAEGASRFRWEPIHTSVTTVSEKLAAFPDPDPARPFDTSSCSGAVLCGPRARIELPRDIASARRWFKRRSFWDVLMAIAVEPQYVDYSYRLRADIYRAPVTTAQLAPSAGLLKYDGLTQQILRAELTAMELASSRNPAPRS